MAYTTIDKPQDYFNTLLYSGDGSSSSARTGVGFQPDWLWFKVRNSTGTHAVFDIVRGTNGTVYRRLLPQDTGAEDTAAGTVLSIDSDGFTLGNDANINQSGETYVSWNWLAANGTSSNTDGSLTSTVSVNTTSGFSIVKIDSMPANTTSTFGHGLGVKPDFIILKSRNNSTNWDVYHSSITPDAEKKVLLNSTSAASNSGFMNDTPPTTSVVSFDPGGSSSDQIAYCFHSVKGYSKFGKYTGNGSSDGTFIYTGFKPAFIMTKRIDSSTGGSWQMYDNKRLGYNVANYQMKADKLNAEDTSVGLDILSNGFKMRNSGNSYSASGADYIYIAFAENPFVSSTGIPGTAR